MDGDDVGASEQFVFPDPLGAVRSAARSSVRLRLQASASGC